MIKGLPERLRELRLKLKLSQRQIAELTQLSPSLISAYEIGERTPNLENVFAFYNLYNCGIDYLIGKQKEIFVTTKHENLLTYEQSKILARFIASIKQNQ